MALADVFGPTSNPSGLVDKIIGDAFPIVRHVSNNMDTVKHVSANLQAVYAVSEIVDDVTALVPYKEILQPIYNDIAKIVYVNDNLAMLLALFPNVANLLELNANTEALFATDINVQNNADAVAEGLLFYENDNFPKANQVAAEAGTGEGLMTSIRTKQAIDAQVTAKLATEAVAKAGTNNTSVMTPLSTTQSINARIGGTMTTVEFHGALGDGNNDTLALQAAVDMLHTAGGGVLLFGPKTYGVGAEFKPKPNVTFRGIPGKTILRLLVDNIQLLGRHGLAKSGAFRAKDIIFEGFADRNPTLGDHKLVNLSAFEVVSFDRCEFRYSRNMGVGAIADRAYVTNCHIHHIHRDALNLTGSAQIRVENNIITEAGDDGIACHVSSASAGIIDGSIFISRNTLRKTLGIKCLGARQTVVTDNNLRFYGGYGIHVGIDSTYGEGFGSKWGITVTGNVLVDGYNATRLGAGSQNYAIFINGGRTLGTGGTAIATLPGNYDAATASFIFPGGAYANKVGAANPSSEHSGLIIANNVVRQTIEGAGFTKFSDSGYGQLWSNAGYLTDISAGSLITSKGFIFEVSGVQVAGIALSSTVIDSNTFEGISQGFRCSGTTDMIRALQFTNNIVRRARTGFYIEGDGAVGGSLDTLIAIRGNTFDIDPYCENAERTTPINGTWTATDGSDGFGVNVRNIRGAIIENNTFLNCRRPVKRTNCSVVVTGNTYIYDWSAGTPKGIAAIETGTRRGNRTLFMNSDPTSADFNKYSTTPDSGFVTEAAAMPSTGYYAAGQVVENSAPAIVSGKVLIGWRRLTTSNAHVLNTDWVGMYEPNS